MPIMPLTKRGISTSRLVLGCMPFGGGWNRNPITNEDVLKAEQAIDAALSIGISMFDHANIYTMGKAEETFGTILKRRPDLRERIVIQSKCGIAGPRAICRGALIFPKLISLRRLTAFCSALGSRIWMFCCCIGPTRSWSPTRWLRHSVF